MRKWEIEVFLFLLCAPEEAVTSGERINMNLPIRGRVDSFKWPLGTLACLLRTDIVWKRTHTCGHTHINPPF